MSRWVAADYLLYRGGTEADWVLIQLGSYIRSSELRSNPINQVSTEFYQFAIRNIQRT